MSDSAAATLKASAEATQVEYRRLGTSGLKVSIPIIGAMSFGTPEWASWVIGEEESGKILKAAYDRGLNTVSASAFLPT